MIATRSLSTSFDQQGRSIAAERSRPSSPAVAIGRLDEALDEAQNEGWTVMGSSFSVLVPFLDQQSKKRPLMNLRHRGVGHLRGIDATMIAGESGGQGK